MSIVATFAADVARLSEAGDAVAAAITRAAADELALSVTTALRRVAHPEDDLILGLRDGRGVPPRSRSKRRSQPRCPPTSAAPRWISSRHAARASTAPSPSPGSPRGTPSPSALHAARVA